jgi:hypothetical protein
LLPALNHIIYRKKGLIEKSVSKDLPQALTPMPADVYNRGILQTLLFDGLHLIGVFDLTS